VETIFRVQNGEGSGPYGASGTGVSSQDWARDDDTGHDNLPTPKRDGIDFFPPGWICGFDTIEDLHEWFLPSELINMKALGFNIWELSVSSTGECGECTTQHGDMQMIFDPAEINHQEVWGG
jgi:hypothetical protein